MSRPWPYPVPYRARLVCGIVCLLGGTSLAMMVPWLLKTVVDGIVAGRPVAALAPTLGVLGVVALVQAIVRTGSRAIIFNVGRDIEFDLRNDLFAHLERLPLAFY